MMIEQEIFLCCSIVTCVFLYYQWSKYRRSRCKPSEPSRIIVPEKLSPLQERFKKYPFIIGIAGGSGSGKTTFCHKITQTLEKKYSQKKIVIISQDSYYKNGDTNTNFDVPESIDFDLLLENVRSLINGENTAIPSYDFTCHMRKEGKICYPADLIIIEGILIFTQPQLLELMKLKIFINASIPTMIFRRISRDMEERRRTLEEIKERYIRDIDDSYHRYVRPSQNYANYIINNNNGSYMNLDLLLLYIENILQNQ